MCAESERGTDRSSTGLSNRKALMLAAWDKAQDPKQPARDRVIVSYQIVNWMSEDGETGDALSRFPTAIKLLQENNMTDKLAVTLTSQAECLGRVCRFDEAIPVIEKALFLKEQREPESLSTASTISGMAPIYIGADKLAKAEESIKRLQGKIAANRQRWKPERIAYYEARVVLSAAGLEAARHEIAKSEVLFKKSMSLFDRQFGPGSQSCEEALLWYVKTLKRAKLDSKADFYNGKLDHPVDFSDPAWQSRSGAWS